MAVEMGMKLDKLLLDVVTRTTDGQRYYFDANGELTSSVQAEFMKLGFNQWYQSADTVWVPVTFNYVLELIFKEESPEKTMWILKWA